MAIFRDRFNTLFDESKLSQEEFGKLFGASKSQIFNWRNGRGEPDSEMMKIIANKCCVSADWLIGKSAIRISPDVSDNSLDEEWPEVPVSSGVQEKSLPKLNAAASPV